METNWAAEQLQTIRTLMERSAVYRRALAPIMLFAGGLGILAAATGLLFHLDSIRSFGMLWLGAAAVAIAGSFLVARQQALKDKEVFWSPPTRRVGQALLPPLFTGFVLSVPCIVNNSDALLFMPNRGWMLFTTLEWILFYGCALSSAGFFMPRGIKFFGWSFIGCGGGLFCYFASESANVDISAHWIMGFFFGVLHLAYGAYLYLTEKGKNAA
jgi:hypothetical protein